MTAARRAQRPQSPAGPSVPGRAGGPHLSALCLVGEHGRCRHPANLDVARTCDCVCHVEAAVA